MKIHAPFIKILALFLVFAMFRVSLCAAAGLVPGSLALLEGSFEGPEMGAAWEQAKREIFFNPRLLAKGEKETTLVLDQWKDEGQILVKTWETVDSEALQRISDLMEKAWSAYFTFSFEEATALLGQAEDLIFIPGDSQFRTRVFFESRILKGMILRARKDPSFAREFTKAAALDPGAVLAPDRYSPEVIEAYNRAKNSLKAKGTVSLTVTGTPDDADVFLNGKKIGRARGATGNLPPGVHFIEAKAPGYEPWSTWMDVDQWEHPCAEFNLKQAGPPGEPALFFLERLEAGDRPYLSRLVERLDVDYILIPDGREGILKCWLIDAQGVALEQVILWGEEEDQGVAARRMSEFTAPLRFEWGDTEEFFLSQVNLPPNSVLSLKGEEEIRDVSAWKRYGPVIVVLLVVGIAAAASGGESGGTSIEVAW